MNENGILFLNINLCPEGALVKLDPVHTVDAAFWAF